MAIELVKLVGKGEAPPPTQPHWPFIAFSGIMWQIGNILFLISRGFWVPKLTERWFVMNGWSHDHERSQKNPKKFISSHTKLDKIGAYDKKSKSTNSYFFSITSSDKVTWLMKNVIFRLPWGLMSVISTRWWLIRRCY